MYGEHCQNISSLVYFLLSKFSKFNVIFGKQHSEKDKDKEVSSIHTYNTPVIHTYNTPLQYTYKMFLYSSRNVFNTDIFFIHLVCCCCFFFLQYIVHGTLCCQIISYNFVIMVYFSTFLNVAICDYTFFSHTLPQRESCHFFLECILRNYNLFIPRINRINIYCKYRFSFCYQWIMIFHHSRQLNFQMLVSDFKI